MGPKHIYISIKIHKTLNLHFILFNRQLTVQSRRIDHVRFTLLKLASKVIFHFEGTGYVGGMGDETQILHGEERILGNSVRTRRLPHRL